MIVVAENCTVTDPRLARAVRERDPEPLRHLGRLCRAAGAAYLDVNLGAGRHGGPEAMTFVLETLAEVWQGGVLVDTTRADVMAQAARVWSGPVVLNGYSGDPGREAVLEVAAATGADLVVLLMARGIPRSVDERLALAAELVGRCAEAGVAAPRLWLDPVVAPLGWIDGQGYDADLLEVLRQLPDLFGAAPKTVLGLSNLTTRSTGGAPLAWLQEVFLAAAAGAGLSHAMFDVRNPRLLRVARALAVLRGERLFAAQELAEDG